MLHSIMVYYVLWLEAAAHAFPLSVADAVEAGSSNAPHLLVSLGPGF